MDSVKFVERKKKIGKFGWFESGIRRMTVEDVINKNVLVGIRFDGHTKELLDWALVKVADPGDRVIALHVCRNSGIIL